MAISVMAIVPAIKGKKPNCPFPGLHFDELIKCQKLLCSKIGTDFRYSPKPISSTNNTDSTVMLNIAPPAILFLRILYDELDDIDQYLPQTPKGA